MYFLGYNILYFKVNKEEWFLMPLLIISILNVCVPLTKSAVSRNDIKRTSCVMISFIEAALGKPQTPKSQN